MRLSSGNPTEFHVLNNLCAATDVPNLTIIIIIIIINDTLARSLEPVVTECKEHTIHTQTQIVASRKPKEMKHTHEGEANFT